MRELGPEARAFLESVRGVDDPTPEDRERVRAALAVTLAAGAVGTGATAAAQAVGSTTTGAASVAPAVGTTAGIKGVVIGAGATKTVITAVAVTVLGSAAVVGMSELSSRPEPDVRVERATDAPTRSSHRRVRARQSGPVTPEAPTPPEVVVDRRAAEPARAPEGPLDRARRRRSLDRTPAAAEAQPSEPARVEHEDSTLVAELTLLRRAQAALGRGETREALRLLDTHEARFPAGALVAERDAARVLTLCDAGRSAEARRAAERFLVLYPESPLRARVEGACR